MPDSVKASRAGFGFSEFLVVIAITGVLISVTLQPGFTVTASASPAFDYLGRSLPEATYTVTNTTSGATLTVSVSTSGRVTMP